jgi:lipoprotein-releasing system permease protein
MASLMLPLKLDIAITHIRGRARQTIVSVLGVSLGVGFSVAMAALMQGSQDEFVSSLINAMPHVHITDEYRNPPEQPAERVFDAVAFSGLRAKEDTRGILNPTAARAALRAIVPGHLTATLTVQGVARYAGAESGLTITGIIPVEEKRISSISEDMRQGHLEDLGGNPFGIVIGDKLARKLGAQMGDQIEIASSAGLSRRFRIVGLFHTGVTVQDNATGLINLKAAQILAERTNAVNEIRIRLADAHQSNRIAAQAERLVGYKAVSWQEANEALLEAFFVRNVIMFTVVGAILLVAGFGIFNIVSIITHEKSRDIAILKSLGFAEGDMRQIFLLEGLVMGVVGAILGWALGYGLTVALSQVKFELEQATEVTSLPVVYELIHYAIAGSIAICAAAIAGYLPARKASRVNPVDIIRGAS